VLENNGNLLVASNDNAFILNNIGRVY